MVVCQTWPVQREGIDHDCGLKVTDANTKVTMESCPVLGKLIFSLPAGHQHITMTQQEMHQRPLDQTGSCAV